MMLHAAGPSYNGWTPSPAYYAEHFKRLGVSTVIRTNQKLYDASEFTRQVRNCPISALSVGH